jgi:hypothetical protein
MLTIEGPLPTFPKELSSPALSEALIAFREHVSIPAHLPQKQRRLLYRPSLSSITTGGEAFEADIEGEKIILEPSTYTSPPFKALTEHVLQGISTKEEFAQIVPKVLSDRMVLANSPLSTQHTRFLIRIASDLGCISSLLDMLAHPKKFGILWTSETRTSITQAIHKSVVHAPPEELLEKSQEAFRVAKKMVVVSEAHLDRKHISSPEDLVAMQVERICLMTAAGLDAISREMRTSEREHALSVVAHNLRIIGQNHTSLPIAEAPESRHPIAQLETAALNASRWLPLWHGLEIAKFLRLDFELGSRPSTFVQEASDVVANAKAALREFGSEITFGKIYIQWINQTEEFEARRKSTTS